MNNTALDSYSSITSNPSLNPMDLKHKLKRKRIHVKHSAPSAWPPNSISNSDIEEEDSLDESNDENSNSSTSSSVVSTSSGSVSLKPIKHGHKILVTEEKMSNALKDLQIEVGKDTGMMQTSDKKNIIFDIYSSDEEEENENEEMKKQSGFLISDELKNTLRDYNSSENYFLKQMKHEKSVNFNLNKMQLIPWSPGISNFEEESDSFSSSSSSSSESSLSPNDKNSTFYKVEEPSEINSKEKNKLKRKFSQLNKICIEEVTDSETPMGLDTNFYLVEQEDDQKNFNASNKTRKNLNITEIDDKNFDEYEEAMEI